MGYAAPMEPSHSNFSAPTVVAIDAAQGQRLDNFLLGRLKGVPRSRVYRMLRRGEVRVDGARKRPDYRLQRGDQVRIPPHRHPAAAAPPPAPRQLFDTLSSSAIYEDDSLIVLNKPSGLAVHGGSGVSFGVVETLRAFHPKTRYELAHRLDRDTSGCLAVAKNRRTLLELHAQFRRAGVRKRYDLLVAGSWPDDLRSVDKPLKRYTLANGERRVRAQADGEAARTDFAVVERLANATWLAAHPRSGRTHQIRVHAAASGHPILGDDKYADRSQAASRLMLHASALTLTVDGTRQRFQAPLPAEFDAFKRADRCLHDVASAPA